MTDKSRARKASQDLLFFIESNADVISETLTRRYFEQNPGYVGEKKLRIQKICKEDAGHHLRNMRNALRFGVPEIFGAYAVWLRSVFESRDLDAAHVLDGFKAIGEILDAADLTSQDRGLVSDVIAAGIFAFAEAPRGEIVAPGAGGRVLLPKAEPFLRCLIANDRIQAVDIVEEAMQQGSSLATVSVGLVQPAMYEIGRLWQINQLTVAQEHLATAISQSLLAKAFGWAELKDAVDRRALFSCVEGSFHTLGLRMVSDAFEVEGWSVDYLGANTPVHDLILMLDSQPADLLGLSVSMYDQVETLAGTIEKARGELGSRCPPIAVGGLPLNETPSLLRYIRADAWFSDAASVAVQAA